MLFMKLSQSKTLTGVLLALFFAASCEELPEVPTNVNLGVTPKEVTIPAEGGTAKVSFNAPVSWEATTSVDWLSISPASGESGNDVTITLVAKANGSTDRRTASVTVTVVVAEKKFTESVNVIQEGATPPEPDPSLEVSVDGFKFNAEGGDGSFNIVSNLPWSAKVSADWLSLTQYSGDAGTATVIVTGARNETIEARRGTVTVTAGNLQKTVTVSQEGASAWISVSSQKEEAPADGATISLTVSSNAQWSASASSRRWSRWAGVIQRESPSRPMTASKEPNRPLPRTGTEHTGRPLSSLCREGVSRNMSVRRSRISNSRK